MIAFCPVMLMLFKYKWYKDVFVNIYMDPLHSFLLLGRLCDLNCIPNAVIEGSFHCNTVTISMKLRQVYGKLKQIKS